MRWLRLACVAVSLISRSAVAGDEVPNICGLELHAQLPKANTQFELKEVGPERFILGGNPINAVRLEGVLKRAANCPIIRKGTPGEPDIVLSKVAATNVIRLFAHRTPQADCQAAARVLRERFGPPTHETTEVIEWNPSTEYSILLTRYAGSDCWVSYIATHPKVR